MLEIVEVVVCTIRVVKMMSTNYFTENLAYFVLERERELLLTVLSNFEREAALKDF